MVQAERALIARELHDVVAHNVSVMVIQAGAVRHRLSHQHDRERAALEVDRARGPRGARRDAPASGNPADGVRPRRVADTRTRSRRSASGWSSRVRSAGVPVEFKVHGNYAMPAGIGLAVYRIVQEALTNVLKHAAAAPTDVTVNVGPRAVEVVIRDHRPGADQLPPGPRPGGYA